MKLALYRFRSTLFPIDPREDDETNPFCYGRSLAGWLRSKLASLGHSPEEVIPEDFGWIVVLSRGSGMLWVGCVNDRHHLYSQVSPENKASYVPDAEPVAWNVWIATDKPMWSLNLGKRKARIQELERQAAEVSAQVKSILNTEPQIEMLQNDA
jgi:hypothetical protein